MNKIDKKILLLVILLNIIGIFIFLSASLIYLNAPDNFTKIFVFQLAAIIFGFFMIFFIQKNKNINYLSIKNRSIYLFLISLLLQLAVLIPGLGLTINGSTRWLDIGFMSIQPSEFFRFASILFLGNILFILSKKFSNFKFFLKITLPVFILVAGFYFYIKDLGSFMILVVSVFSMFLFTDVDKKKLLITSLLSFLLLITSAWFFSPHAHKRIEVLINPEKADVQNGFYQQSNMMKAIGSGKITGVGYGESLQKFNRAIPEIVSDSIFSIYAEEFGFIGSIMLLFLYLFLAYSIFSKIHLIKNKYQKLIVAGLGVNILFPAFYNIAAAVSLVPLSGIPLTFISKGGTSIFFSLISVGIILLFSKK